MDVLIVEDDQEQLDGIESILLEKYDHMNCIKATNYQQATQLMHANKIQLFLLDISLGEDASEQDGIELGTQIRSMQRYAKNTNPVSDCIFHGCTTCNTCNELL